VTAWCPGRATAWFIIGGTAKAPRRCTRVNATLAAMSPHKVDRTRITKLTDLPNIGKASANDLRFLGIEHPSQLIGKCPFELYRRLCQETGQRHDPCVIDVFMSVTQFMNGDPPRPWWDFTETRKKMISGKGDYETPKVR